MKNQNTTTKQTVSLPVRMSQTTYVQLKDTSEVLGVKPSIYIKSLIINDLRRQAKVNRLEEILDSLPQNFEESDDEVMKNVIKEIDKERRGR